MAFVEREPTPSPEHNPRLSLLRKSILLKVLPNFEMQAEVNFEKCSPGLSLEEILSLVDSFLEMNDGIDEGELHTISLKIGQQAYDLDIWLDTRLIDHVKQEVLLVNLVEGDEFLLTELILLGKEDLFSRVRRSDFFYSESKNEQLHIFSEITAENTICLEEHLIGTDYGFEYKPNGLALDEQGFRDDCVIKREKKEPGTLYTVYLVDPGSDAVIQVRDETEIKQRENGVSREVRVVADKELQSITLTLTETSSENPDEQNWALSVVIDNIAQEIDLIGLASLFFTSESDLNISEVASYLQQFYFGSQIIVLSYSYEESVDGDANWEVNQFAVSRPGMDVETFDATGQSIERFATSQALGFTETIETINGEDNYDRFRHEISPLGIWFLIHPVLANVYIFENFTLMDIAEKADFRTENQPQFDQVLIADEGGIASNGFFDPDNEFLAQQIKNLLKMSDDEEDDPTRWN